MRIEGEVTNMVDSALVTTEWSHSTEDPWAVEVAFREAEVVWHFSIDLLQEAFETTDVVGSGDVRIVVEEGKLGLYLSNGQGSALILFPAADIQEFLSQVDDSGSEEVVARELDEFLDAL